MDNRIGAHGGQRPRVCAVTGQLLAGRPFVTFALTGVFYGAVLAKAQSQLTDETIAELTALAQTYAPPTENTPADKK